MPGLPRRLPSFARLTPTRVNPKTALYVFQREEYDEGMGAFSDPISIDISNKTDLDESDVEATILYNIGQLCLRLGENEEALESFCLALKSLKWNNASRQTHVHDLIAIAILHNIGHLQYRTGMYDDAVRTYSRALQIAKSSAFKFDLEVAASLNCLGVLYFHQPKNKSGNSMDVFVEALAIRRAILGSDHKDVATALNNIGRVHYMKGEFVMALATYHEAVRIRKLLLGDDHLDVGATVYNTGQTHHQIGDLDKAMDCYKEFWRIASLQLGNEHRDVAVMLKCMAQIYHEQKKYDQALKLYKEALTSRQVCPRCQAS